MKPCCVRQRFAQARWLFLTNNVGRTLSPSWVELYQAFARWNAAYQGAAASVSGLP